MNDTNVHILNRFGTLSNVKKRNFVRKMSTIENIDDIMRQMSLLTNIHFEWNRESLLDFIKNNGKRIVFDKPFPKTDFTIWILYFKLVITIKYNLCY